MGGENAEHLNDTHQLLAGGRGHSEGTSEQYENSKDLKRDLTVIRNPVKTRSKREPRPSYKIRNVKVWVYRRGGVELLLLPLFAAYLQQEVEENGSACVEAEVLYGREIARASQHEGDKVRHGSVWIVRAPDMYAQTGIGRRSVEHYCCLSNKWMS